MKKRIYQLLVLLLFISVFSVVTIHKASAVSCNVFKPTCKQFYGWFNQSPWVGSPNHGYDWYKNCRTPNCQNFLLPPADQVVYTNGVAQVNDATADNNSTYYAMVGGDLTGPTPRYGKPFDGTGNGLLVNSVPTLITMLKTYNSSPNPRLKASSAFIVFTLLGHSEGLNQTVSAADWTNVTNLLNYSSTTAGLGIEWNHKSFSDTVADTFSIWDPAQNISDVAWYNGNVKQVGDAIIIHGDGGTRYAIWRDCANLDPNSFPILWKSATITPTLTSPQSGNIVRPGDPITFNYSTSSVSHRITVADTYKWTYTDQHSGFNRTGTLTDNNALSTQTRTITAPAAAIYPYQYCSNMALNRVGGIIPTFVNNPTRLCVLVRAPLVTGCSISSPLNGKSYSRGASITLSINVTAPVTITRVSSSPVIPGLPSSYSSPITFTVNTPGTYTITATPSAGPTCSTTFYIVNEPFFEVLGGDIEAGIDYGSGCTPPDSTITAHNSGAPNYYGASGQMAAIATDPANAITGFTSAENPDYSAVNNLLGLHPPIGLTLSNDTTQGVIAGQLDMAGSTYNGCVPDYYNDVYDSSNPTVFGPTLPTTSGTYNLNGAVPLGANIVGNGGSPSLKIKLVVTDQNVIISNNITYHSYGNVGQMPMFELIDYGGSIFIDHNVTKLEGIYIAEPDPSIPGSGHVVTCAVSLSATADFNYNDCKNPLVINGSVSALTIDMLRSGGDSLTVNSPVAETYMYGPEAWIPQAFVPTSSASATPPSIVSLPPVL